MDWLSGGLSLLGTILTNDANEDMANSQMSFQREMSNTSYQRAVKDMEAAGLNPMLAYSQGGATTPGGAMAVMQNALGNAVNSAQSGAKLPDEVQLIRGQVANTAAQTTATEASTAKMLEEAENLRVENLIKKVTIPLIAAQTKREIASAGQLDSQTRRAIEELEVDLPGLMAQELGSRSRLQEGQFSLIPSQMRRNLAGAYADRQSGRLSGARIRNEFLRGFLDEQDVPRSVVDSDAYGSGNLGWKPFADAVSGVVNSASTAARAASSFRRR